MVRGDNQGIRVLVGGEQFTATEDRPFVFGRDDDVGVVGLDPNDMGISAEAGSIDSAWGLWWIVNRSRKRRLLIETSPGAPPHPLACGDRFAITTPQLTVLVPGAIYTHRLEVCLPPSAVEGLRVSSRASTGTMTADQVVLSGRDRTALAALFSGYLRPFPRRDPRPLSYQEAAELLGSPWSKVKVRKQVERLRERLARAGQFFEGGRANDELAEHLIGEGILTVEDLARLPAESP